MWMLYGLAVLVTLSVCWLSASHVLQKLALLMLTAWALSNACVALLGFAGAPYVDPTIDAMVGVLACMLGVKNRSYVALAVVAIFLFELGFVSVAFSIGQQGTRPYYLALNLLFLAQLGVLGGSGVAQSIGRIAVGPQRVFHRRVST